MLEDAAQRFRAAATDLRNLEGPEGEQEAGRDLARSLDQLAGEVDRLVVAIEEGDEDVALEAVREGLAYRDQITAACSDFGAGSE